MIKRINNYINSLPNCYISPSKKVIKVGYKYVHILCIYEPMTVSKMLLSDFIKTYMEGR